MARRSFHERNIDFGRMNDQQYIEHLETTLLKLNENISQFIEEMDKASFTRSAINVFSAYTENVELLQKL